MDWIRWMERCVLLLEIAVYGPDKATVGAAWTAYYGCLRAVELDACRRARTAEVGWKVSTTLRERRIAAASAFLSAQQANSLSGFKSGGQRCGSGDSA